MPARRLALLLLSLSALPLILGLAGCNSLKAISINPASGVEVLRAVGQTAQFTALGASQMGSATPTTSDISNSVTWAVSNPNVASINASGLATAIGPGYTQVTATSGGIVATSDLTVNIPSASPAAPYIALTPTSVTETFTGETTQFTATGSLTGTTAAQNLNSAVQWVSSNVQVATVSATGLATAVGAGTTTITARSGGLIATATLTVTVTGLAPGTPTLTVTPSTVTEQFTGETTQFTATGNLTGVGSLQNLTTQVQWISSNAQVATITSGGLATAVSAGTTTIVAQGAGLVATAGLTVAVSASSPGTPTITITPNAVTEAFVGETTQFTAAGSLTGIGAAQNLTSQVQWVSSNSQVATVNASGLATAVSAGTTTISAQSGGLVATAAVNVAVSASATGTPAITITPSAVTEGFIGETTQFTAAGSLTGTGSIQNLTGLLQWSSSNPQIATITPAGLATAVSAGTTTITAQSGGLIATATLNVATTSSAPGVPTLNIAPGNVTEAFTGETTQFTATGTLTGTGSLQNLTNQVTWSSSNTQVASVTAQGLVTSVGAGTTTISAQSGGLLASTSLTVSSSASAQGNPTLALIPGSAVATFSGETTQFIAIGNLTGNGPTQNLTSQVSWTSSDVSVATINSSGLATAINPTSIGNSNTTTITAIAVTTNGSVLTASSVLQVTPPLSNVSPLTLSIYEVGSGSGRITSTPISGSPGLVDCGAGGTTCQASFALGSSVTLTEVPSGSSTFAGWSATCVAQTATTCTVIMTNNEAVGAIFQQ